MKPLENILVLDLTRVLAGPYCTMLLSDLGARVIKVEQPGCGDDSRHFGPFKNDRSGYFLSINRGKESIAVNLKKPEGQEIIRRFAKIADVLVENFRPGAMEKLGLGYVDLKKLNPGLIYAASSGFGHTGPWAKKPAYDMIVQAMGGIMSITGWPDGPPTRVGASIGDITAALFTAIGINAALYQRALTGEGQKIDVAMLDCQLAILENALVRYSMTGTSPGPLGARHPTITPFQAFKTMDSWVIVAIGNDKLWEHFCQSLNLNDLLSDPRFSTNKDRCDRYEELAPLLDRVFIRKTTAEWEEMLNRIEIPCTRINQIEQVMQNPQLKARNMFMNVEDPVMGELTISGNPIKMSSFKDELETLPAPELGEHNESVLTDLLGYTKDEIDNLRETGVI
ncbi:MAG: CaiB/BaiF CoA-transferase family protein [Candidatus Wallbacteria bacterium]|nr:CaiB/BaiF CoA-transferase family protein [Candidatus Wallbacteria bacterium]